MATSDLYSHTNRHPETHGGPWGWITRGPEWNGPSVAYWSGWPGQDGVTVLLERPRQQGHDYLLPWEVRTGRSDGGRPSWRVLNSLGYEVLSSIYDREIADKAVALAGVPEVRRG